MKTAIYIRVSTEDQAREGYSLEVQREYLTNFALQQGYEIYNVYADEGISAGSTDRPALQKLLKDAKQKKFSLVLVYKIDRFSRRLKDLLDLVEKLESFGTGFKSVTEPFDTTTSAGKLMFQQLGSFAEFERNRHAERVFPGMVKSVLAGNWHGSRHCPFGYTYNKQEKLLKINLAEAKVVKLVFKMFLSGRGINEITDYLNRSRHETRVGRYFYSKLIRDILKNRLYIGQVVWNKYHYDKKQKTSKGFKYVKNDPGQVIIAHGKHEPIISAQDFEKVQQVLADKKIPARRARKGNFIFTGLLYCDKCNHRYFGVSNISNHRTGQRSQWYRCSGRQQHYVRCNNCAVKADQLEQFILSVINNMLESDKLRDNQWLCLTAGSPAQNSAVSIDNPKQVENSLKTNQEKQLKLTDLYLKNLLSEQTFKQKNQQLREQEDQLRKQLAGIQLSLLERENSALYLEKVKDFLSSYTSEKQELDKADRRKILGIVFKKIKINNRRNGRPHPAVAPVLFEPFQKIYSETLRQAQGKHFSRNERKKCDGITLKPMAAK